MLEGSTRPDVYARVHRGLRKALTDLMYTAGRTVWIDDGQLALLEEQSARVIRFLHHHGENEDRWALPVLEARLPGSTERDSQEHVWIERDIARVERALEAVRDADTYGRRDAGEWFYHKLCSFIGAYLVHMTHEETEMQPLFHAHCSDEEIRQIGRNIVANTEPEDLSAMLGYMLPSFSSEVRAGFIGEVAAGAPPQVLDRVLNIAERVLTPTEWKELRGALVA